MKVTIFDVRIKWQLIALRCGTDPLWKIVIITSSRRLEVGWKVSWKRGKGYIANGSRTANAVKRIFERVFCPPAGGIFNPKIIRETTTYWG
jgi:hypothetical protein